MAQPPNVVTGSKSERERLINAIADKRNELLAKEKEAITSLPSAIRKTKNDEIQKLKKELEQLNIQNEQLIKAAKEAAAKAKIAAAAVASDLTRDNIQVATAPQSTQGILVKAKPAEAPLIAVASTNVEVSRSRFAEAEGAAEAVGGRPKAKSNADTGVAKAGADEDLLLRGQVAPAADATLTANQKAAAEEDAKLKAAAAQAATLTPAGPVAQPQPVLEADTDEPKKKAEPDKVDKFPKFPASGDWIAQLMWLLDVLFFNSSAGRPPIIDKEQARGFIQRFGEGFANLAADFTKNCSNANRLISGTLGAGVRIAANAVRGAYKITAGAVEFAKGLTVTAVGGTVTAIAAIPKAIAKPPQGKTRWEAYKESFALVAEHGVKPLVQGGAKFVDGVGNALSIVPTGLAAVRDAVTGSVGMVVRGAARLTPWETEVQGAMKKVDDSRDSGGLWNLNNLARVLSGNDPAHPSLTDRLAGVEPQQSAPKPLSADAAAEAARIVAMAKATVTTQVDQALAASRNMPAAAPQPNVGNSLGNSSVASNPVASASASASAPAMASGATQISPTLFENGLKLSSFANQFTAAQANANHDQPPADQSPGGIAARGATSPLFTAAKNAVASFPLAPPQPAVPDPKVAQNTEDATNPATSRPRPGSGSG